MHVPGESPVLQWRYNFKKARFGMRARLIQSLRERDADFAEGQDAAGLLLPVRRRATLSLAGPRGPAPPARFAETFLPKYTPRRLPEPKLLEAVGTRSSRRLPVREASFTATGTRGGGPPDHEARMARTPSGDAGAFSTTLSFSWDRDRRGSIGSIASIMSGVTAGGGPREGLRTAGSVGMSATVNSVGSAF